MDSIIITALLSVLFLLVGFILGWLGNERYTALMCIEEHDYDELFEKNPHPECYDEDGKLDRGDYLTIVMEDDFEMEMDEDEYEGT